MRREVDAVLNRFSEVSANTYVDHPWPGWDGVSADFWGPSGRGHALQHDLGWKIVRYVMRRPGQPFIRHLIYLDSLWTRTGGWQLWASKDHSGRLRHVHVSWEL